MTGYLIKVTYTEGIHTGYVYYLRKGGWVTDLDAHQWTDDVYKTEGIARRVCKHMYEENERNREFERKDEEYHVKKGFAPKPFYIYQHQTFEPCEVDVVGDLAKLLGYKK